MNELLKKVSENIKKNQFFILLLIALILIILQIQFIGFKQLLTLWASINLLFVIFLILCYSVQFLFRAWVWIRISREMNIPLSFFTAYFSIGIGWMVNEILPAKLGDLVRIDAVVQNHDIPFGESTASVVFQRLVDLSVVLLIGGFSLLFYGIKVGSSEMISESNVFYGFLFGIGLIFVVICFITFLIKYPSFIKRIASKLSPKVEKFVSELIDPFITAIKFIKKPQVLFIKITGLSFSYWLLDILTFYFAFNAAGISISPFLAIFAGVITYLIKMFPLTPGGWGIAESVAALFIYSINSTITVESTLFVLIMAHAIVFIYSCIFGIIGLWLFSIRKKSL